MSDQINVAYEALGTDASKWDEVAGDIDGARNQISSISVYRGAFSFAATGVADSYLAAHAQVVQLLTDASGQATGVAEALRQIRNDFETNEAQTQAELAGIWEEK